MYRLSQTRNLAGAGICVRVSYQYRRAGKHVLNMKLHIARILWRTNASFSNLDRAYIATKEPRSRRIKPVSYAVIVCFSVRRQWTNQDGRLFCSAKYDGSTVSSIPPEGRCTKIYIWRARNTSRLTKIGGRFDHEATSTGLLLLFVVVVLVRSGSRFQCGRERESTAAASS